MIFPLRNTVNLQSAFEITIQKRLLFLAQTYVQMDFLLELFSDANSLE